MYGRVTLPRAAVVASVALLTLGLLGCDDDGPGQRPPIVDRYDAASTPAQLVENLVRAYNEKSYEEYDRLLHEDFIFEFAGPDIDLSGTPNGQWDRQRDTDSTRKMFQSQAGREDSDTGVPQAPIVAINLILTENGPEWTDQVPLGFEGTLFRRYSVSMDISFADGNAGRVTGVQEFYVLPVETQVDGETVTVYELKWWRDTGAFSLKATGTESFGGIKSRF